MNEIKYSLIGDNIVFMVEDASTGFIGRFFRAKKNNTDVDDWVAGDAMLCDALGTLRLYGEDQPGTVRFEDDRIIVKHAVVAALSERQMRTLGLPDHPPFVLYTDTEGIIGSPSFKLITRWLDAGLSITTIRQGAFLKTAKGTFTIPDPLYSALELADSFDAGTVDLPDHWSALAQFRRLLDSDSDDSADSIEMSKFLRGLSIYTGSALSLALREDKDSVDFDPVLFNSDTLRNAEEEGRPLIEADGILPAELLQSFQNHKHRGFRAFEDAKRSYSLGRNNYLIVDDDLETVLQVVREKQKAGSAERRAFAANPRAEFAECIHKKYQKKVGDSEYEDEITREEEIEARVESLLIETSEYADRAIGIGIWQKPKLDFLRSEPNQWLPEIFSLELDGVHIRLDADAVSKLRSKVKSAIDAGESEVTYRGERIPATRQVQDKLDSIIGTETPSPPSEISDTETLEVTDDKEHSQRIVVRVRENFIEENWSPKIPPREARIAAMPSKTVKTQLLDHQQTALKWQIEAWKAGHPGILNADDQGLGKTLQTLAFLAWLQDNMAELPLEERSPILIVAPTGLLRTWEEEEKKHLMGTGLGARLDVYGQAIRNLRVPDLQGKDTDDGRPRLEFKDLNSAIEKGNGHRVWLLTTYETLANYQHSFRKIDFSVVVFDEIQKIKNVKTLNSLAARSTKADFRIGLTGTPIENNVADLWAIVDAISLGGNKEPGRLGLLRDFIDRYNDISKEKMSELHHRLFTPVKSGDQLWPPIAQRHLKEGVIADLPRKDYHLYPSTMPRIQAEVYEHARSILTDGRGSSLKKLHHIRGVSLHPEPPDSMVGKIKDYFDRSARLTAVQNILSRIRDREERTLIFIEDLRMQAFVAQWLRSEFGLKKVRTINGNTPINKRKKYVTEFQSHITVDRGFDVMILSPRAAGVGLTLTAATHVIHLSRWWNAAVEEQCNDRIYRIGQKRNVTIHLPLAIHPVYKEKSFDCVLNDLIRRKRFLARVALWPPIDRNSDNSMLFSGVSGAEAFNPAEIDDLDWESFEYWIMDRARDSGDWEVSNTPRTKDGGADAILRSRHRKNTSVLVQVKHTINRERLVDDNAVRQVLRSKEVYAVSNPQFVVITNSLGFTNDARKLALENDVKLVDRDRLSLWPQHVVS